MAKKTTNNVEEPNIYELAVWHLFIGYGKATDAASTARVKAYAKLLQRYDILVLNDAIDRLMLREKFLPSLSEIADECQLLTDREMRKKLFKGGEWDDE